MRLWLTYFMTGVLVIVATSCVSGIRNNLEYSIGKERKYHDAYFGVSDNYTVTENGFIYIYELNGGKCIYELYVDKQDMVQSYKFLTDYENCYKPVSWGGAW